MFNKPEASQHGHARAAITYEQKLRRRIPSILKISMILRILKIPRILMLLRILSVPRI